MKAWLVSFGKMVLSKGGTSGRNAIAIDPKYVRTRNLIITADDFGASKNINDGIRLAVETNSITTISALTNFPESLPELKKLSETHPEIGIGVHLNITTGKPVLAASEIPSLVNAGGNFYTIEELLPKLSFVSLTDLKKELKAQIQALANTGIRIDHLSDQNGILSFYSPSFEIVTELALEFDTPVRTPAIAGIKYPDQFPDSRMKAHGRKMAIKSAIHRPLKTISLLKYAGIREIERKVQKLDKLEILHPDLLIEYLWGNPTLSNLNYILEHLPVGTSELILHLGSETREGNYPSGLDLDYFVNREKELMTITNTPLKEYCKLFNINTIGYSDLPSINIK